VNLFYQPQIIEGIHYLDEEESKHCVRVLRKREGELIHLTDGHGTFYDAVITKADPRQCAFKVQQQTPEKKKNFSIHIAIAPTKNTDRIEWFVEKSVELGIDHITLVDCKNSERSYIKTERLKKVAISAMKQSVKATLPLVTDLVSFNAFIKSGEAVQKFIAFVDHSNPLHLKDLAQPDASYIVLIGPEGDFSDEELTLAIASGYTKVSLGASRLRTETAGMAACHVLNLVNQLPVAR
jgi:16S rRNA (uracil1498-N3)-methyltransferase